MFEVLLESGRRRRYRFRWPAVSLALHAALLGLVLPRHGGPPDPVTSGPPHYPVVFPSGGSPRSAGGAGQAGSGMIPAAPALPGPVAGPPDVPALPSPALPDMGGHGPGVAEFRDATEPGHPISLVAGSAGSDPEGPVLLAAVQPAYPAALRATGVSGRVRLEFTVDSLGRVGRPGIQVLEADHPGFVEPAVDAVLASRFRPARQNGRAIAVRVRQTVMFRLVQGASP